MTMQLPLIFASSESTAAVTIWIVRRGKLVNEFLGRRATIPDTRIAFLQNDHATALNFRVIRIHRRRDDLDRSSRKAGERVSSSACHDPRHQDRLPPK